MKPPLWPSKDIIWCAVTAAASRTGAQPEDVLTGREGQRTYRARVYAALALRTVFAVDRPPDHSPVPGNVAFSKMVGGHRAFLTIFDQRWRFRELPWFRQWVVDKVVAAIQEALRPKPSVPPIVSGKFLLGEKAKGPPPVVLKTEAQAKSFCTGKPTPVRLTERVPFRRPPAKVYVDVTADYLGDPAPGRSALDRAEPWMPYEERVKKFRPWRTLTSSQPSRLGDQYADSENA